MALLLATAALALGVSACGEGENEPASAAGAGGDFFGVNGVTLRAWSSEGQADLVDRHLAQVEASGAGFVRATLGWGRIEPLRPVDGTRRYDFTDTDRWVAALARHGLRWSILGGAPPPFWAVDQQAPATCANRRPPERAEDFAAVMGAVAGRYGSEGEFWALHPDLPPLPVIDYEVWNAPNNGSDWCPTPDPEAYADLYATTWEAVHAADSDARVVIGGLGAFESRDPGSAGYARMAPGEFLARMLAHRPELVDRVDAVGIHVYAVDAAGTLAGVAAFRQTIDASGLAGVPIVWNEVGWSTSGERGFPPTPEKERAALIGEVTAAAAEVDCGIVSFALHTWVTFELDPADPEDWFGISEPETGEPYPSALAYRAAVAAADPAPSARPGGSPEACRVTAEG